MRQAELLRGDRAKYFFSTMGESYFPPTWLLFRRCLKPTLISSFANNARRRNGFELRHRNRLEWINGTWSHLPWHVMQTRVKERQTISLDEKVERARRVNGASTSRFATRKRASSIISAGNNIRTKVVVKRDVKWNKSASRVIYVYRATVITISPTARVTRQSICKQRKYLHFGRI